MNYWGLAPLFLNLSTVWKFVVSLGPGSFTHEKIACSTSSSGEWVALMSVWASSSSLSILVALQRRVRGPLLKSSSISSQSPQMC
jgi:tRNA A37 threonylcarbamoyladenosine modification protein TsaB